MPHKKDVRSQPTFGSISRTSRRHQKILHLPHKKRRWGHKRPLGPGHENFSEASYSTCHAKRTWGHKVLLGGRVTSAPATQNGNRVTRNFPEASKILHLPHKKKVGSSLSPMICTCHTKRRWNHKKCSEASKNIAPATQRERIGSRRTARRQGRNLPQNGTSVTGNFSQCHGDLLGGF